MIWRNGKQVTWCGHCKQLIEHEWSHKGRLRKYCSNKCRQAAYRERKRRREITALVSLMVADGDERF